MRWPALVASAAFAIAALGPGGAPAQVNEQRSGIVESIEGPTLVLRLAAPPARRVTLGTTPSATPALPPTLVVDLDDVPASQWVFLRPGEQIAVVGVTSGDGRRFAAIRVIGGAGPRREPQAP